MPTVGIVGGGLAGLSAALAMSRSGARVELFEARAKLGGRAGSFDDPRSGETLDFCQHVAMGCCTATLDFCRAVGAAGFFRPLPEIVFVDEGGRTSPLKATNWLPAPLHLAPAFARLGFLTLAERRQVAGGLWRLLRLAPKEVERLSQTDRTFGDWLTEVGQSPRVVARFWSTVLVSALSETVDRAAFGPARKVFVDGFAGHADAWKALVPQEPFDSLYENHVARTFAARGVVIHRRQRALALETMRERVVGVRFADGARTFDATIVALPWRRAAELMATCSATESLAREVAAIEPAPITSVHLAYDRPPLDSPVALIGRTSQWLFPRAIRDGHASTFHVQAVISASRAEMELSHERLIEVVDADVRDVSHRGTELRRTDARVVHQPEAVFSPTPANERRRPEQATPAPGLFLAGDWTRTGWPATMEGAILSGRFAAVAVARSLGLDEPRPIAELPRGWLARLLFSAPSAPPW